MSSSTTATNLAAYTTFGVQASADAIVEISELSQLQDGIRSCSSQQIPYLILGSGSNMLFAEDFPGTIFINQLKGIKLLQEDDNSLSLEVFSGENWHDFVAYCLSRQWFGLENLALIPGTIGASPIQNIGAYGTEVSEYIDQVFVLDLVTNKRFWITNADCEFGYRESLFKKQRNRYFIEKVQFSLLKGEAYKPRFDYQTLAQRLKEKSIENPTPHEVFQAVIDVRTSRLPNPTKLGNAGSFFKNPIISRTQFLKIQQDFPSMPFYEVGGDVKIPAGWLIEQCGLKGIKNGAVGTYEKQALVLVNHGGATAAEVWNFATYVIEEVNNTFGIVLTPEVNVVRNAKIQDYQ